MRHRLTFPFGLIGIAAVILGGKVAARADGDGRVDRAPAVPSFAREIRPILAGHCFKCHGSTTQKADLDLRSPAKMEKGGVNGPAIARGASGKSLLYEQVSKRIMPPGKAAKLTDEQVRLIARWIDAGAMSDGDPIRFDGQSAPTHWAFRPPVKAVPPIVKNGSRMRSPIDAFVLAKLEAKGLTLAPAAQKGTLLRRATFDLTGLPPTPEEIEKFLTDAAPEGYERMIDRLLASPAYGERWGRHWLDNAGYADTHGGDNDLGTIKENKNVWKYRDYVIRSLNADKPFDRFVTEQLAGDEEVDWRRASAYTPETLEGLVATGFLRNVPDDTNEAELNRPLERNDIVGRVTESVASNLLGLTFNCARCHNHKYDPITQDDYFRLVACFTPAYDPGRWKLPGERSLPDVPPGEVKAISEHNAAIDRRIAGIQKQGTVVRLDKASLKTVDEASAALAARKRSHGFFQAVWEDGASASPTRILRRGDWAAPMATVEPGFPVALSEPGQSKLTRPSETKGGSSGRRLALARWLTASDHPLLARVVVNRLWQHHFGVGIVATPDNFGLKGAPPSHPELLDWLAVDLAEHGWRLKRLHKLIMTSAVYRQSSRRPGVGEPSLAESVDPANDLLGRRSLRRLEAEALRDAVLATSGGLKRRLGGPPTPLVSRPDGLVLVAPSDPAAASRRSLYLFARRNYPVGLLDVFDFPIMALNCTRRPMTATPLQSLAALNSEFVQDQAVAFAARVRSETSALPRHAAEVERAFLLAFARSPSAVESRLCVASLERQAAVYRSENASPEQADVRALEGLCQMLLCANEFLYIE